MYVYPQNSQQGLYIQLWWHQYVCTSAKKKIELLHPQHNIASYEEEECLKLQQNVFHEPLFRYARRETESKQLYTIITIYTLLHCHLLLVNQDSKSTPLTVTNSPQR